MTPFFALYRYQLRNPSNTVYITLQEQQLHVSAYVNLKEAETCSRWSVTKYQLDLTDMFVGYYGVFIYD
jgi:hypothetical protein